MKKIYASFNFDRISPELAQLILDTLGEKTAESSPTQTSALDQTPSSIQSTDEPL